jgi:beta-lactamase class A
MRSFSLLSALFLSMTAATAQNVFAPLVTYLLRLPAPVQVSLALEPLTPGDQSALFIRADDPRTAASLIKLPVMVQVMCLNAEDRYDLDEIHILLNAEKTGGSGQLQTYPHRSRITYRELLREMMIQSDNTATNIFIDEIGMPAINDRIRSLGLTTSVLARRMMDTTAARQGRENRITAREMNGLLKKIYGNQLATPAHCAEMLTILKACEDRLTIPAGLPPGTVVAHKTGTLPQLRADAGIVFAARPFVLTVIVTGAATDAAGEKIIANITRLAAEAIRE